MANLTFEIQAKDQISVTDFSKIYALFFEIANFTAVKFTENGKELFDWKLDRNERGQL